MGNTQRRFVRVVAISMVVAEIQGHAGMAMVMAQRDGHTHGAITGHLRDNVGVMTAGTNSVAAVSLITVVDHPGAGLTSNFIEEQTMVQSGALIFLV